MIGPTKVEIPATSKLVCGRCEYHQLEYEYLRFDEQPHVGKTKVFACRNRCSGDRLGTVGWYGAWRQYVYYHDRSGIVYSAGCLRDIAEFLEALMAERRRVP